MKRNIIKTGLIILFAVYLFLGSGAGAQNTHTVSLLIDVQPTIAMIVDDNTINFGDLVAGTPSFGDHGIAISIGTNAANGYVLNIEDRESGSDSSMVHTDAITHISDFSAPVSLPQTYPAGSSKGLGFTLFDSQTNKETKWGNGLAYNDANNKYAGIPESPDVFHQSPGYKAIEDYSYLGFVLDVPNGQKNGSYSGSIVLSATCMLN